LANSPSRQNLTPLGNNYDLDWANMSVKGELDPDHHTGGSKKQDNCWICEGWVEASFSVDLLDNLPDAVIQSVNLDAHPPEFNRVYLHCDFDQWQPDMTTDEAIQRPTFKGRHQVYRMLPKNTVMYFYSHNGVPFVDKNKPTVSIDDIITDDINRTFWDAEEKKRDDIEKEEELKAAMKLAKKAYVTKKVHPPAGAEAFSCIITRDERRNQEEPILPRPENRYGIPLDLYTLG